MGKIENSTERLLDFIGRAVSPYHSVEAAKAFLCEDGFEELDLSKNWKLEKGGKYVVTEYGSGLFAFTVGKEMKPEYGFRIGAAHGDYPGFRIKPQPEMVSEGYLRLNVEGYGGAVLMSWLDRPLSIAGKVALKSEDVFHPTVRLVDFEKPMLTIPNLAIHMNREINKGVELKKQSHMLPLLGMCGEEKKTGVLKDLLAEKLGVSADDILDYELCIYNAEKGTKVGASEELISAPRLDNQTSVVALLYGITGEVRENGVNMAVIFDHEEIGSRTKQGAGSLMLNHILEKIYLSLGYTEVDYKNALTESLLMSADVSHAFHPAYADLYDPTNRNCLNKGFSIKLSSSQSYATDSEVVAIIQQICEKEDIPYQKCVNHADQAGGGTLGSIASALVPVRTGDIGVPTLAMHSSRELIGAKDQESIERFLRAYYTME